MAGWFYFYTLSVLKVDPLKYFNFVDICSVYILLQILKTTIASNWMSKRNKRSLEFVGVEITIIHVMNKVYYAQHLLYTQVIEKLFNILYSHHRCLQNAAMSGLWKYAFRYFPKCISTLVLFKAIHLRPIELLWN